MQPINGLTSTPTKDQTPRLVQHGHCIGFRSLMLLLPIVLCGYGQPARAIDTDITIAIPADITAKRAALITQIWGRNSVSAAQPQVTFGVANPFQGLLGNLLRVDQYTAWMSNGQTNTSNLYLAASSNDRVVILNLGHNSTCDWSAFSSGRVPQMLQALLDAGYSVFAMNMPGCGDVDTHVALFANYGNAAMGYFIEPAIQAMNYWDTYRSFANYNFVGFSGGGWTAVVLAALDPRIKVSVQIAGSMPGVQFVGPDNPNHGDGCSGCAEQNWTPFYNIAGYEDLYLMGSYEVGRKQLQIPIANDSTNPCCYSSPEWDGTDGYNYAAYYGQNWDQYLHQYQAKIHETQASIGGDFNLVQDYISTGHEISSFAIDMAVVTLNNMNE